MGRYMQRKCISVLNSKIWDDSHIHNKRFSRAALTKYHRLGGLNFRNEFTDTEGSPRSRWHAGLGPGLQMPIFFLCLHNTSLCFCLYLNILSCKNTSHTRLGASQWPHFTLIVSLKIFSPLSTFLSYWVLGSNIFWGRFSIEEWKNKMWYSLFPDSDFLPLRDKWLWAFRDLDPHFVAVSRDAP